MVGITVTLVLLTGCGGITKPINIGPPIRTNDFVVKLTPARGHITLHYPTNVGEWREVCVGVWGRVDDRREPGDYIEWYRVSCWKPTYRVEDFKLPVGVYAVRAELLTVLDGVPTTWGPPPINIRPLESPRENTL